MPLSSAERKSFVGRYGQTLGCFVPKSSPNLFTSYCQACAGGPITKRLNGDGSDAGAMALSAGSSIVNESIWVRAKLGRPMREYPIPRFPRGEEARYLQQKSGSSWRRKQDSGNRKSVSRRKTTNYLVGSLMVRRRRESGRAGEQNAISQQAKPDP